jgi:gas vesicle protein
MAEDTSKFTYFLAGLGFGALIGLLFAPRSGEETRDFIGTKAQEGREFVGRKSREGREFVDRKGREVCEQAGELIEQGKEAVARQKSNINAAFEAGKQAYREAAETPEPPAAKPSAKKPGSPA